jgi:hypothetical protein
VNDDPVFLTVENVLASPRDRDPRPPAAPLHRPPGAIPSHHPCPRIAPRSASHATTGAHASPHDRDPVPPQVSGHRPLVAITCNQRCPGIARCAPSHPATPAEASPSVRDGIPPALPWRRPLVAIPNHRIRPCIAYHEPMNGRPRAAGAGDWSRSLLLSLSVKVRSPGRDVGAKSSKLCRRGCGRSGDSSTRRQMLMGSPRPTALSQTKDSSQTRPSLP